jgi:hypothetical protein
MAKEQKSQAAFFMEPSIAVREQEEGALLVSSGKNVFKAKSPATEVVEWDKESILIQKRLCF